MATINISNNASAPFTVSAGAFTVTSGNAVITSGNVTLPTTTSSVGQILINGATFIHATGGSFYGGFGAGNFTLTGGTTNVCVGSNAGNALTSATDSTFIGANAGLKVTTGIGNSFLGSGAGSAIVGGGYNLCLGYNSGSSYTGSESSNITLMNSGTVGESNVIRIGTQGSGNGQQNNCWIAGVYSPGTAPGATQNAVMVDSTGKLGSLAGGVGTILIGGTAPTFLTAGTGVIITSGNLTLPTTSSTVGQITINSNRFMHAYGTNNTFLGSLSANFTLTGTNSTGIGYNTLHALTSGSYNSACGSGALAACTSGANNSAYGASSLAALVGTYGNNTAMGYQSLAQAASCTNCTAIGYQAGYNYTTTEASNICIGAGVTGTIGESNVLRIGAGTGTGAGQLNAAYISGIQTITVTGAAVYVSSSDQLGVLVSSARYKENIRDMGDDSNNLHQLRPVTFNYKSDESKATQYGLIAEEVAEVYPELTHYDKDGKPFSVAYHVLPAMLLNEIQKLHKRIAELEAREY